MKKLLLLFLFFRITSLSLAQAGLGYYFDYYNHFYVFDKGNTVQLESNHVDSIRVGDDWLSYIDQRSDLVVYRNGDKETIEEDVPYRMTATAHALVYKMQQRLMIYENGVSKQLASWVSRYFAGDSIVIWQALPSLDVMVYKDGEINTIESGNGARAITSGRTGKNIFAYNDLNNEFKIYYNGQVTDAQVSQIRSYKCGYDVVAYVDAFNNSFNAFSNGEIKTITDQLPKNYSVTGNTISYIDALGNFMAYLNGQSVKIESYEPLMYTAKENIIAYYYTPELKAFYNGRNYVLESSTSQQNVTLGINSVLYVDNRNRPKFFYKGKLYDNVLTETPTKMALNRDLPVLYYGTNSIGFFYNGKLYEYQTLVN